MGYYILPHYGDGLTPDYVLLAEQERERQWNIAKEYILNPSLPNIFNAISAAWNALPFNTTAATVNPHMQYGEVPAPNGPKSWVDIQKVLAARKAASAAKSIKPAVRVRKSPYDGLTQEEIEIKRQQLSAAGKIGGAKSSETRGDRILKSLLQAEKNRKVQGMLRANKEASKLNPASTPSVYSRPGRIYNNGAITSYDLDL